MAVSQKESPDEAKRTFSYRHHPKIIEGLNRKAIAQNGRKLHPTDICAQTSPEILAEECLFFGRHCAMFLFSISAGQ